MQKQPAKQPHVQNDGKASRFKMLLRAFRHRNYRLFFFGQLVSLVGTWMQSVAQSWLIYRLTDSTVLLGTVSFASQFPVFVFASLGGAVADRYNRRRLLVVTQGSAMLLALTLASLTLSGIVTVLEILVLATLLGVVNAFDIPGRQAFVVEMVGRDDLANAIALNSSIFNGARIVGPAIAGILVAAIGEGWCFTINGLSFSAVIIALLLMKLQPRLSRTTRVSVRADIINGLQFARSKIPIRSLLMLLAFVSLAGVPYIVLMPIFADRILHTGARGLGLLMGSTGVGALTGALTLASRRGSGGLSSWIAYAALGFGLCLILFAGSHWFVLSAVLLVPVGFFMMVQMAASNTLLQMMTPDELRGRVMALYTMMFMGMAPLGAIIAGFAANYIGVQLTVAAGGLMCMLAAWQFGKKLPEIKGAAREMLVAQQMLAGAPAMGVSGKGLTRE